jgi:hypothetical protein
LDKSAVNPITNPNPVYSHTQSRDNWCHKWVRIDQMNWIKSNRGKIDAWLEEMKDVQGRMEAKTEPIARSLRTGER